MQIKYQRKQWMTLLEVLVAFSILSVLLVFLFGFFRELTKLDELTRYQQVQLFRQRYVESRLHYLFARLVNEKDTNRVFYFFLEPADAISELSEFSSLVFTYNNGIRQNPFFSGDVISRLYVDKQKRLCLVTWPCYKKTSQMDGRAEMEKEILLERVEAIRYEFFAAPTPLDTSNLINRGSWSEEWFESYKESPVLMKIHLTVLKEASPLVKRETELKEQTEDLLFIFHLPFAEATKHYIHYPYQP